MGCDGLLGAAATPPETFCSRPLAHRAMVSGMKIIGSTPNGFLVEIRDFELSKLIKGTEGTPAWAIADKLKAKEFDLHRMWEGLHKVEECETMLRALRAKLDEALTTMRPDMQDFEIELRNKAVLGDQEALKTFIDRGNDYFVHEGKTFKITKSWTLGTDTIKSEYVYAVEPIQ